MEYFDLNNGNKMSKAGIGTFMLSPDDAESATLDKDKRYYNMAIGDEERAFMGWAVDFDNQK